MNSLAALLCAAAALGACKKSDPGPAATPSTLVAKHSCDRRAGAKLCVEYLGALATEAYVKKECASIPSAAYLAGPCPAGSIGRCAKFVGGPSELHELHYQGNFDAVKQLCIKGEGVWKLSP